MNCLKDRKYLCSPRVTTHIRPDGVFSSVDYRNDFFPFASMLKNVGLCVEGCRAPLLFSSKSGLWVRKMVEQRFFVFSRWSVEAQMRTFVTGNFIHDDPNFRPVKEFGH